MTYHLTEHDKLDFAFEQRNGEACLNNVHRKLEIYQRRANLFTKSSRGRPLAVDRYYLALNSQSILSYKKSLRYVPLDAAPVAVVLPSEDEWGAWFATRTLVDGTDWWVTRWQDELNALYDEGLRLARES